MPPRPVPPRPVPPRPAPPRPAVLVAALSVLVAGCSPFGSSPEAGVTAAPRASDPACTAALATAPQQLAGRERVPSGAAGALAWGEPPVVLRCGLPEQPPTTLPCLGVNGTDWIVDVDHDPFVFTSYGRSPAVEVRVPASVGRESAVAALTLLSGVPTHLPATGRVCVGQGDVSASASP